MLASSNSKIKKLVTGKGESVSPLMPGACLVDEIPFPIIVLKLERYLKPPDSG
jgi:hypothetical protein